MQCIDLLGTANLQVNYWLSRHQTLLAYTKVGAIVGGHVLGVIASTMVSPSAMPSFAAVCGWISTHELQSTFVTGSGSSISHGLFAPDTQAALRAVLERCELRPAVDAERTALATTHRVLRLVDRDGAEREVAADDGDRTAALRAAQGAVPDRSRGVIALLEQNCTSCMLCARECPDWCIYIDSHKETIPATTEGAPAYGPVITSLTITGDTSPASVLAVDRFPTAPRGAIHYDRSINFNSRAVARAIKHGKGVIVIHGVDYNHNGTYDFASAGKSDLDPSLPAEATDPALCGVLR